VNEARASGLPGPLPAGESVLWQGRPRAASLALHAFRLRAIAIYFAALVAWSFGSAVSDGHSLATAATYAVWPAAAGLVTAALVLAYAYATARTSFYAITTKRLVLRTGIALPLTVNLPIRFVDSVQRRAFADGSGDLLIGLAPTARIAYLAAWPHVRFLHPLRPRPALRGLDEPQAAADALVIALTGRPAAQAAAADVPSPSGGPIPAGAA
jgi:hypothetical protein